MSKVGLDSLKIAAVIAFLGFAVSIWQPDQESESIKARAFFETAHMELIQNFPEAMSRFGYADAPNEWNPRTAKWQQQNVTLAEQQLQNLVEDIQYDLLDKPTSIYYRAFQSSRQQLIAQNQYRNHDFVIRQIAGLQNFIPRLLSNLRPIDTQDDAVAYIELLRNVKPLMSNIAEDMLQRADQGYFLPQFAYSKAAGQMTSIIEGMGFAEGDNENIIFADFSGKLSALELDSEVEAELLDSARSALKDGFSVGYSEVIVVLNSLKERAPHNQGVQYHPDGNDYYQQVIDGLYGESTDIEHILEVGRSQLEKNHQFLRDAVKNYGIETNDITEIFEFLKTDQQFYFPNTDEGRAEYLGSLTSYNDSINALMDTLFFEYPDGKLTVQRVEPHLEEGASIASYLSLPNGDGIYYLNMFDMSEVPIYLAESLFYHEGLPGHHLGLNITNILDVPSFIKDNYLIDLRAYHEGWAMYTETMVLDYGLMSSDMSQIGRIVWEIIESTRLLTEVGANHLGWTREQSIEFLTQNAPFTENQAIIQAERFMVWPGQATSYIYASSKFLALYNKAKERFGDDFDIKEFHARTVGYGPLPLNIIEDLVNEWIEAG